MFESYSIRNKNEMINVTEDVYRAYNRLIGKTMNGEECQVREKEQDAPFAKVKEISEVLMKLPGAFGGTLAAHMERLGVSRKQLEMDSAVSDSTIKRMRTSERDFELDHVIAICIGLHLEPDYSFDLIEKAGFRLRNTPDHLVYKMILRTLYQEELHTVQELLRVLGCRELKLKEI